MDNHKTIAVTGANGFMGLPLCKLLLEEGYSVISVVAETGKDDTIGEQRKCDITDEKAVSDVLHDSDLVVHLAAVSNPRQCRENFDHAYKVNVGGTKNVLKATRSKRLIFASSSHVYDSHGGGICSENDRLSGKSPYAITKIMGEMLCTNYSQNFNYNINILRFFNIFGENQNPAYLIPFVVNQALTRHRIAVRQGKIIRDFLHVTDAVRAILAVIKRGQPNHVYNIGSGTGTPVSQICKFVSERLGDIPVEDQNIPNSEPPALIADISNLKKIGWQPEVSLQEGINEMIEHHKRFL